MRKVLLVYHEQYLDRALQDVGGLINFKQQRVSEDEVVDLLAVVLVPPSTIAPFTKESETFELVPIAGSTKPFASDSVSVNGVWSLLTAEPLDVPEAITRQESLSRVLSILRANECVQSVSTIIPVFSPEEDERSVAEQMAYLQSKHPSFPMTTSGVWSATAPSLWICGTSRLMALGEPAQISVM